MSNEDKGKIYEKIVSKELEGLSSRIQGFAWHRLPDAKASRNFISAQPSDMVVIYKGVTTWLEIKSTMNPTRLPKAKVSQWGTLYKFHLAGANVVVLVYQSAHKHWVYLTNGDLFSSEDCPASFVLTGRKSFSTAAEALQEIFQ